MDSKQKYEIADSIAADAAEKYMASEIASNMIEGGDEKAKIIRTASENNINQGSNNVQEFRRVQREMMSVVYDLLDGAYGYKLEKLGE